MGQLPIKSRRRCRMKTLDGIVNFIDKINELVGRAAKYLLFFMAAALLFEVIARYVFDSPTIWAYDVCKQLLCIIGALGGGYALLYNAHVKVDVLYERWSVKSRALMDIITSLLFFTFIIVLIWKSTGMAVDSWIMKETATTLLSPPIYPIKTVIAVGAVLIFLQGIAKLLRDIKAFITGEENPGRRMDYT
jgi:TRAP-type mannitol/chloroaromatic compound transport system permease small subunit